jgi:hypothetical protein
MAVEKLSPEQIENWRKVKEALEASGKTECFFYKRAVSIISTGRDPMRW